MVAFTCGTARKPGQAWESKATMGRPVLHSAVAFSLLAAVAADVGNGRLWHFDQAAIRALEARRRRPAAVSAAQAVSALAEPAFVSALVGFSLPSKHTTLAAAGACACSAGVHGAPRLLIPMLAAAGVGTSRVFWRPLAERRPGRLAVCRRLARAGRVGGTGARRAQGKTSAVFPGLNDSTSDVSTGWNAGEGSTDNDSAIPHR